MIGNAVSATSLLAALSVVQCQLDTTSVQMPKDADGRHGAA